MDAGHLFITGGTGFIGTRLCRRLLDKGYALTVLTRDKQRAGKVLPPAVNLVNALRELDTASDFQAVINLAGEPLADRRWNEHRKQLFYDSRVGLTAELFDHFSAEGVTVPRVLISGSAIGFYGPRGDEPVDERDDAGQCFASELCRAWESMACQFENLGTRVCCVRTGIVLGPGGGALQAMRPIFKCGLGGPIGNGRQWMSWIHLDDEVEIIVRALEDEGLQGPINATAPSPARNREFGKTLGRVLSRPAVLPAPAFAMKLLFGQMADELLLSGQRVAPAKIQNRGFEFRYPELEPALRSILNRD